jgi:predicted acetyltransferase
VSVLVPPTVDVHASFLAAMAEFAAEGRGGSDDRTMIGDELREHGPLWSTPAGFRTYVLALRAQALEGTPRPEWFVPCTTLWWVDGTRYVGRVAIRHRLSERLREIGGHIGYDVRPSARRRGHATAMLRAALPVARGLGIESALLTCDVTNAASRRVIEANGGVLVDERAGTLRYRVSTSPR